MSRDHPASPEALAAAGEARRIFGLSPAVMYMSAFNFTLFMAWQMAVPVVPLLAADMNASPFWIGMTVGARGALPLLLGLPAGWVIDRTSPRVVQVMAAAMIGVAATLMWGARSIPPLMIGQALVGLAVAVASITGQAFIAVVTDTRERDEVYGRYSLIVALDNILGPALGGLLAQWGGPRTAILGCLVFALASLPLAVFLPNRRVAGALPPQPGLAGPSLAMLRRRSVLLILVASFLFIFGYSLRGSFYVLYLDRIGYSSGAIGLLLSISGAAMLITRPMLAWLVGRHGRPRLLVAVSMAMGVSWGLVPAAGGLMTGQVALAVLNGMAYGLSQPLTITMVSHAVPADVLGLAFAWRQIFSRGGDLVGPLLLGWVAGGAGLAPVFWVAAAVLMVTGLVPSLRGRR